MAQKGLTTKSYSIFDGDGHVLEPADIWDEYLEPEYRVSARSIFWRQEGEVRPVTILNGKNASEPFVPQDSASNIPRYGIWQPGMTDETISRLDPHERHAINPGGSDPSVRLKHMDAMGIDQALLFPTHFAEYFPLVENPDIAEALARAYNNWISDYCKAAPDRLFPVAVLPVQEINACLRELRRTAKMGFRGAFIRPVFVQGNFPHQPYYYPLWRELEEIGVMYCSHATHGTNAPELDSSAPFVERVTANLEIGHPVAEVIAPTMDQGTLLLGMMGEGLLEKYPDIKFYFAHSKASWVHLFLEKIESYLWLSIQADPVSLAPDKIFFNRNTLVNFDVGESAIWELPDLFEKTAVWGSFYPNHDTYTGWDSIERLASHGIPEGIIEKLMGSNLAKMLGVDQVLKVKERAISPASGDLTE